jgi:hypothetical protein
MAMRMRSVLSRVSVSLTRPMDSTRGATRYFSDDKGRVLSEEERAAETVYIQVLILFFLFSFAQNYLDVEKM